jgi:hypothetical protein
MYRDYDGYYTRDQISEAIDYAKDDPIWGTEHWDFYGHLIKINGRMIKYGMDIVLARDVVTYDKWYDSMVISWKIKPIQFVSERNVVTGDPKVSAPRFREAEYCGNCKHFNDLTDYDDMLNGECEIHTMIDESYTPPLKIPLILGCGGVCNDFVMKDW